VHFTVLNYLLTTPRTNGLCFEIHLISDEPQRARFDTLPTPAHATLTFHALGAEDMYHIFHDGSVLRAPPYSVMYKNGIRMLSVFRDGLHPSPDRFLSRVHRIVQVVQDVRPDVFVFDIVIHAMGLDAANKAGIAHIVIGPTASVESFSISQPGGRGPWKYPL
jgi:hypothetical protein